MSDKITSNETYVREGGAAIRTRCLQSRVTDAMIAMEAQRHKLDVGDVITVQCMNHERDTVLWQRRYLVARRRHC